MDYNWLENVPSSLTPVPVYQPDFGFLQSMQMKANQQYEQGLKEVKNSFSSIFNRQVTGEEATKRQNDYKKQALTQMKAIAATDLSDPKNVQIAEDILSPFYDDKLYLENIAMTSHYQNEFAKQEAMKHAKTKEERELYNPTIDYYLNKGLEQLASAPMTKEVYSRLERRKSIGVVNFGELAKKHISDVGYIKTVDANGNEMIITTNGPKSVEAYSSVYKSIAARPEYAEQNRVFSIARMEMQMDQLKKDNPNIPEDQLKAKFADEAITGNVKWYAGNIADYRKTALEWKRKNGVYVDLDGNGNFKDGAQKPLSPEDQKNIEYNLSQAKNFEEQARRTEELFTKDFGYLQTDSTKYSTSVDDYIKAVDPNSTIYQQRVNDIKTHTQDYIQNVYLSQDADAFAKGLANLSSVEIKVNPVQQEVNKQAAEAFKEQLAVFKATTGVEQKQEELDRKELELKLKAGLATQEDLDKYYGKGFSTKGIGISATGQGGVDVSSGDIQMTGTNIRKVPTIDTYNNAKLKYAIDINVKSFSPEGMLNMISEDVVPNGLTGPEILTLSTAYNKCLQTGKYDPESLAVREKAAKLLNSLVPTKNKVYEAITGPNNVREALGVIAATDAADPLFKTQNPEKQSLVMKMAMMNQSIQKDSAELLNLTDTYQKKLAEFLKANPQGEYSKITKTTTDPKTGEKKYDVITNKDVADDLKKFGVYDVSVIGQDGQKISLSNEELANAFLQNDITFPSYKGAGYDFQIGSKYYNISSIGKLNFNKDNWYNVGGNRGEMMKVLYDAIGYPESNVVTSSLITDTNPKGSGLVGKYGLAKDVKEKMDKIGENVISRLSQFATGESSPELTFDLSGTGKEIDPTQKKTGEAIIKTMQSPINRRKMYIVDGSGKEIEDGISNEIETAITDAKFKDFIYDIAGAVSYVPIGPNGVPAIRISTQLGKSEKDNETIGTVKISKIKDLRSIYMDIADNAKGDIIQQLPKPETFYRYGKILTNENSEIKQDDFEKANGFTYTIKPDPYSKNEKGLFTKVYVYTSQWQVDPKTGQYVMENGVPKSTPQTTEQLTVGPGGYSIDHVCQDMKNNWILGEMQKRRILLEANRNKTSSTNTQTIADIYKKFGYQQ